MISCAPLAALLAWLRTNWSILSAGVECGGLLIVGGAVPFFVAGGAESRRDMSRLLTSSSSQYDQRCTLEGRRPPIAFATRELNVWSLSSEAMLRWR